MGRGISISLFGAGGVDGTGQAQPLHLIIVEIVKVRIQSFTCATSSLSV